MSSRTAMLLLASLTVVSALVVQHTSQYEVLNYPSNDPFAQPEETAKKMWEMEDQWNDYAVRFVQHSHLDDKAHADAAHDERDCKKAEEEFHNVCEPYTVQLMQKLGGVRATDSVNKYFKNVCYHMPKRHKGQQELQLWHRLVCAASHDKLVRRMLDAKTATAHEKLVEGLPAKDNEISADIARDSCADLFQNLIAKADDTVKTNAWRRDWQLTMQEHMRRQEDNDFKREGLTRPY